VRKDKINRNNTQQLSQFSSESASLKKQQNQATQVLKRIKPVPCGKGFTRIDEILAEIIRCPSFAPSLDPLSHRLRPFPFKDRIRLSLSEKGRIFRCQCQYLWVEEVHQRESFTIWRCEKCQGERLLRRDKTNAELIEELLSRSLLGGDGTFLREMKLIKKGNGLGKNQRGRLRKIALELGVEVSLFIALVPASGEGKS
jgi:hypothetical protein